MKRVKFLLVILVFVLAITSALGCYVIKGQTMSKLKGTYELSSYTWTNGKNDETTNYVTDEEILYKAYLVVTGTGEGYYVWQNLSTPATKETVSLRYEYGQEDSSKIEYVYFTRQNYDEKKFGVNGKTLNFNKPVVKFSENFYTNGEAMRMVKVDDATDLSYVISQWGELADPAPAE